MQMIFHLPYEVQEESTDSVKLLFSPKDDIDADLKKSLQQVENGEFVPDTEMNEFFAHWKKYFSQKANESKMD